MKRVKTKHQGAERKKVVRQVTDDVIGYMLPLFYIAMKDELGLTADQVRRVKDRVDRYSAYISSGALTFEDIKQDLRKAGYNLEEET